MTVIATFTVPAEDFMLGETIGDNPGTRVLLERVIPIGDSLMPYLWASDHTVAAIEDELGQEPDIDSFTVVDSTNGEALIRVQWANEFDGVLGIIASTGASVLEGVGESDSWRLQLRFDDHEQLSEFFRRCSERDIAVDLATVHNPGITQAVSIEPKLTDAQRETLQVALEEGYFDVPRRINLVDLAALQGISDSAVSQRLRRGIATVLGDTDLGSEESQSE